METKRRHRIGKLLKVLLAAGFIFCANGSHATEISGYEDIVRRYAKGLSDEDQAAFRSSLQIEENKALDDILKKELSATLVERRHIFRQSKSRPTKLFKFNDNYAAIGFIKTLNYRGAWEGSAYILLFQVQPPRKFKYADKYLFWRGSYYSEQYNKVTMDYACKDFSAATQISLCGQENAIQVAKADTIEDTKKQASAPVPSQESQKTEITAADSELRLKVAKIDANLNLLNAAMEKKADKDHTHNGRDITSGIIRQSFIDAAIARDREFDNAPRNASTENVDEAYVTSLENRIMELENSVKDLTELLKGVYRDKDTVVFSGVNVQILDGTGDTAGSTNGKGNLIVGYNQLRKGISQNKHRTGSHNIVLGDGHAYTSYGGFVGGLSNTISGSNSSVLGGLRNTANGDYATVTGGHFQTAEGVYSVSQPYTTKEEADDTEGKGCFIGQLW